MLPLVKEACRFFCSPHRLISDTKHCSRCWRCDSEGDECPGLTGLAVQPGSSEEGRTRSVHAQGGMFVDEDVLGAPRTLPARE